jgi:hypothetical protein
MLKRRQEIYEEIYPETTKSEKVKKNLKQFNTETETVAVSDNYSNSNGLPLDTFTADTAKKTGLSDRTIRRDLQLSKNLDSGGVNGVFGFIGLIKPFPKKLRKGFPLSHFFFFIPCILKVIHSRFLASHR